MLGEGNKNNQSDSGPTLSTTALNRPNQDFKGIPGITPAPEPYQEQVFKLKASQLASVESFWKTRKLLGAHTLIFSKRASVLVVTKYD